MFIDQRQQYRTTSGQTRRVPHTSELTRPYHKNRVTLEQGDWVAREGKRSTGGDEPRRAAELPEAIAIADAARLLGVSPRTIQRYIAQGFLVPFYLPGSGRPRIPLDQINAIRRTTERPKRMRKPPASRSARSRRSR